MTTPPITDRALNRIAARAREQIKAAQAAMANAPALAAPGGRVQRLGGEPLQPRASQYTAAVPVGGVVQYNQGVAAATPLVGGGGGGQAAPGFNGQEQIDVPIDSPEVGRVLVVSAKESYRSQVVEITSSIEGVEATLTPGVGEVAEVGAQIILELTAVPEDTETVTFSIAMRRVQ